MLRKSLSTVLIILILALLLSLAGFAQGEKQVCKAQHSPTVDCTLEELLRMSQTNPAAASQLASQLGVPVAGNMVMVIAETLPVVKIELLDRTVTIRFSLTIATKSKSLIKLKVPLAALLILPQLASLVDIS